MKQGKIVAKGIWDFVPSGDYADGPHDCGGCEVLIEKDDACVRVLIEIEPGNEVCMLMHVDCARAWGLPIKEENNESQEN